MSDQLPEIEISTTPADPAAAPVEGAKLVLPRPRTALAGLVSVSLHLVVLVVCARITISGSAQLLHEIQAWINEEPIVERELPDNELHIAEPSATEHENVLAAEAASVAKLTVEEPQVETLTPIETTAPELAVAELEPVGALQMSEIVEVKGSAGEEVATVEGAVDRITHEIVANLEAGEVLVVWLMDASISLVDDRDAVAGRLERVFRELKQIGIGGEELLNAVVSFGNETQFLVPPTADGARVVDAIREVPPDDSGVENVFSAVIGAIEKYKSLRTRQHRRLMFIVWTDEAGDDYDRLDDAIRLCQRLAVPVFTVGPSATFGRQKGVHAYKRPEDGKVYPIEVDRGPDTVRYELLRLPYWFEGPQYERLGAGIGPFALTRMAVQTGGAYFINDDEKDRSPISLAAMRKYMPEYASAKEYLQQLQHSPLRQAVLHAVDVTMSRELKGTPRLEFEPTGENFQQQLREAQQSVAFNLIGIAEALAGFGAKGLEDAYRDESSPRWRAWYDLTYGRLLAMQVRCNEYNWVCAEMKGRGADFVDQKSNRWTFKPSATLKFGSAAQRQAAEATRLLERCVAQNAGTPWEKLAQRELAHPFGFEIEERYVEPPPRERDLGNGPAPMMGRRVEQLRQLQKPEPISLPKL